MKKINKFTFIQTKLITKTIQKNVLDILKVIRSSTKPAFSLLKKILSLMNHSRYLFFQCLRNV